MKFTDDQKFELAKEIVLTLLKEHGTTSRSSEEEYKVLSKVIARKASLLVDDVETDLCWLDE